MSTRALRDALCGLEFIPRPGAQCRMALGRARGMCLAPAIAVVWWPTRAERFQTRAVCLSHAQAFAERHGLRWSGPR